MAHWARLRHVTFGSLDLINIDAEDRAMLERRTPGFRTRAALRDAVPRAVIDKSRLGASCVAHWEGLLRARLRPLRALRVVLECLQPIAGELEDDLHQAQGGAAGDQGLVLRARLHHGILDPA